MDGENVDTRTSNLPTGDLSAFLRGAKEVKFDWILVRKYTYPEPTVTIGEPETPPTTTTTTTTTTMTTTSTTTTTTTTIPESCIPGVPCDIPACTGWVYLTANDGTVLQVRDSNGNTKYDQICCSGIVSGITPL